MPHERIRTLLVFCSVSLFLHLSLVAYGPRFRLHPARADRTPEIEIALLPPDGRKPADHRRPQPSPRRGTDRLLGGLRSRHAARSAGGGGSPAPSPRMDGRHGARGPQPKPEDLPYAGGGAGGANLPRAVARLGGGGGQEILAVPGRERDALAEEKPGLGPGHGGAAGTGAAGGVGFVNSPGVGARLGGTATLATLRPSTGAGLGASRGAALGTIPPGGGHGTGAELPGTGGEGLGYGRGDGVGVGNGHGAGIGDGVGLGNGRARGVPFGDPSAKGEGGSADRSGRFGITRVIYLLDVSQSMKEGDKLGKAKAALKQALSELQPSDSFNILYFYEDVYAFNDQMTEASSGSIARGKRFVDEISLGPGTNLSEALSYALAQKETTDIYILSDGEPNRGIEDPIRLRRMIVTANKQLKAHISTVALGLGERFKGMDLLRSIAEENAGSFRYVDLSGAAKGK